MTVRFFVHWPGSFLKLIWIGFFCVSFPLVVALVNAGVFAGKLARESSQAVQRASRAASESRLLVDQVRSLERRARQLYVLGEPQMLADYLERRQHLGVTVEGLAALLDDRDQATRLRRIMEIEQAVHRVLVAGPQPQGEADAALDRFVELDALARDVMEQSGRLALEEADAMQRAASRAQRTLLWEASALVPATLLATALFASLLSRPIRRIDQGIRRLGVGNFATPIAVRGPRDLERLGEGLDWLRLRLAELEAEKAKFLAHVSHELKTPLTAIREGVDLLGEGVVGQLSDSQREVTGIIRDSAIRLQRLIENLLAFSMRGARERAEADGRVELDGVVREVLADHKPAILARSLELRSATPQAAVCGDRERVRTIVDNLVSNAVKFSPDGGALDVSVRRTGDRAVLEVADAGPGVPPEERGRIFDPFFQGQAVAAGAVKGSGLGLSIVAEFVEELGGEIQVADAPQGGALFRVELPAPAGEATT